MLQIYGKLVNISYLELDSNSTPAPTPQKKRMRHLENDPFFCSFWGEKGKIRPTFFQRVNSCLSLRMLGTLDSNVDMEVRNNLNKMSVCDVQCSASARCHYRTLEIDNIFDAKDFLEKQQQIDNLRKRCKGNRGAAPL